MPEPYIQTFRAEAFPTIDEVLKYVHRQIAVGV
jgi:hypothetical protein